MGIFEYLFLNYHIILNQRKQKSRRLEYYQCNKSDSILAKSNCKGGKLVVKLSTCNLALISLSIVPVIKIGSGGIIWASPV